MVDELQSSLRVIHDLERAIRHWELLRDSAQRVVNETMSRPEKDRDSVENTLRVAKFQAYVADCDRWILKAKAQIDRLERGE